MVGPDTNRVPVAEPIPKNGSILIVLTGSLGDIVRGLALVDQLKRSEAKPKITWLVDSRWEEFVRAHKGIDRIISFNRKGGVGGIFSLIRELRREPFDITLDLQRHLKSGLFSWFSGARRRIGFHPKNAKEFNWIFNSEYIQQMAGEVSKLRHYLLFLKSLGLAVFEPLTFGIQDPTPGEKSKAFFAARSAPFVAFILGASWRSKEWPESGYEELGRLILDKTQCGVLLLGGNEKREMAQRLMKNWSSSRVVNLVGETTLSDLVALIKGSAVCVGPDSGPFHIAGALNVPYVGLFGATSPRRAGPWVSDDLVIQSSIGCAPCYKRECPGLGTLCMRLISPSAVFEGVLEGIARSEERVASKPPKR